MSIDFSKLTPIARVTEKATGRVWNIYRVASEKGKGSYEVAVLEEKGVAVECTCPQRVNRLRKAQRSCKHMTALTQAIKTGRNPKPPMMLGEVSIYDVNTAIGIFKAKKAQKAAAEKAEAKRAAKVVTLAERAEKSAKAATLNGTRGFEIMPGYKRAI